MSLAAGRNDMNMMRVAVTEILFGLAFVRNRDPLKDPRAPVVNRIQVFLLEALSEIVQRRLPRSQMHLVATRQGAHIRQVQALIEKAAERWLREPVIEGHRQLGTGLVVTASSSAILLLSDSIQSVVVSYDKAFHCITRKTMRFK